MSQTLWKFSQVEARNASPATLRERIRDVLKAENDACADEMMPYLIAPGVSGSREFDHAYAVDVLLEHDEKNGGQIAAAMVASAPAITRRMLWDHLVAVFRKANFDVRHGRVVGLLEDKSGETTDDAMNNTQPENLAA